MLVILSDLHLGDGTATPPNLPPDAFALFLDHVVDLAENVGAAEVKLLLLGDIFDLLRTEHWFYPAPGGTLPAPRPPRGDLYPFPLAHRPWGVPSGEAPTPECTARARAIAARIVDECKDQLDVLSGRDPTRGVRPALARRLVPRLPGVRIQRFYLPGNHDRLARLDRQIEATFCGALGATPASQDAPGAVRLCRGLLARHGHEHDPWNFDPLDLGGTVRTADDYLRTPIGDAITTECLARLPYEVCALLDGAIPPAQLADVREHLVGIEDVRPLAAAAGWLARAGLDGPWRGTAGAPPIQQTIEAVARSLVPDLLRSAFAQRWRERRGLRGGLAEVLLLGLVGLASRFLSLQTAAALLRIGGKLAALLPGEDRYVRGARRDLAAGEDLVAFGHTHSFRHLFLDAPAERPRVYLNSGTWRPRVHESLDHSAFLAAADMTYLVFYEGKEQGRSGRRYETWNGVLRKER